MDFRRAYSSLDTWALISSLSWLLMLLGGALIAERSLAEASFVDAIESEETGEGDGEPVASVFSVVGQLTLSLEGGVEKPTDRGNTEKSLNGKSLWGSTSSLDLKREDCLRRLKTKLPRSGTLNFRERESRVPSLKMTSSPRRDDIVPMRREEPHLIGLVSQLKWVGSRIMDPLMIEEPLPLIALTENWTIRWKIGAI